VYVLDLDVPGATSRVALTTGGGLSAFDISPDGTGIAYITCLPAGTCTLSYSRLDGSGKRTLLARAGSRPRFSPDGGTILTYRWLDTDDSTGAWLVGTDGTGARLLRNYVSAGFAWSPDGSSVLLFRDYYYDWSGSVTGDLLTVRASDGGDEQVLLRNVEAMYTASWVR
jgi:Tol biopolymer transport system component